MKIVSVEFVFGANESAEDLEDESDRYSDRQIIVKAKTPYGIEVSKNRSLLGELRDVWRSVNRLSGSSLANWAKVQSLVTWR